MKKSTYGIIAIIIILMIAIICVFAFTGNNKKENNTMNNTMVNEENNINQNEQINEQVNEAITNEIENEISSEIVENKVENTTSSETFEESPKTAEEKAIDIAKKDFGTNSNVTFSVEGIDENGNYIVVVRNSKTTEALAFYNINVTSQTFTKKEMD